LAFLLQRVDALAAARFDGPVVGDFLFEKDALFAELTLPPDELALYRRVHARLTPTLPTPDLVVYLQAPVAALLARVHRRAVATEAGLTESYLQALAERYARFFHDYDAAPVLTVNTANLNPAERDADFALLLERMAGMRGRRAHFAYQR